MNLTTRRGFLQTAVTATTALGSSVSPLLAETKKPIRSCVLINLVGGPSQLETFDPKPEAPMEQRGPFAAIRTSVPGVLLSETLPKLAKMMHKISLIRTLHHAEAPIHETGLQLLQTGSIAKDGKTAPNIGSLIASKFGGEAVLLPHRIGRLGVCIDHGQAAGNLPMRFQPKLLEPMEAEGYGAGRFGASCAMAVKLVEQGTRFITINMFDTVYDRITWDCHADGGSLKSTLKDYRDTLCPAFDAGFTSMLTALEERGLLESTLVVATGEFGRTSRLNFRGGRDHSTSCWSAVLAGGSTVGGSVIGKSNYNASEPVDHPVHASGLFQLMRNAFGASI